MFRGLGFRVYYKAKSLKVGFWGEYDTTRLPGCVLCQGPGPDVGKILEFVQHAGCSLKALAAVRDA